MRSSTIHRETRDSRGEYRPEMFERVDSFRFLDRSGEIRIDDARIGPRGLRLSKVVSSGHEIALVEDRMATLIAPRSGGVAAHLAGRRFEAKPGAVLSFRPNSRRTTVHAGPGGRFVAGVVLAPLALLETAAECAFEAGGPPRDATTVHGAEAEAFSAYLDFVLAEVFDRRPVPGDGAPMARGLEALLVEFAALALFGGRDAPVRSAALERVKEADAIMHGRFDEPLSMLDLAREVGVGLRSLEFAFAKALGVSPRERLNTIRMDKARALLLAPGEARSVTELALACGFTHLGRFSVAYRRRFGERPVDTLRARSRDAAQGGRSQAR